MLRIGEGSNSNTMLDDMKAIQSWSMERTYQVKDDDGMDVSAIRTWRAASSAASAAREAVARRYSTSLTI